MASLPTTPERAYLSQKFGRLRFGPTTVQGYSVAGEESVVQVPEWGVCFDIGRGPQMALTSDIVCLSHAHMDHVAGIGYYLSQRHFQGMKPGTILLPAEMADATEDLLDAWRRLERQDTPYDMVEMRPGEMHLVRRDLGIRCHRTHHGGPSLSYTLVQIRLKLKDEFHGKSGEQLARLKADGVEIQYRLEVPLVTYMGDTGPGPVWEEPDVVDAQLLLTECTFFEHEHRRKAKAGRHLHVDQFAEILPNLNNEHIVLLHLSRRTGIRRAKKLLRSTVGDRADRIHFLMDFENARDVGDAADAALGEPGT
jgi:ribonuclease Z